MISRRVYSVLPLRRRSPSKNTIISLSLADYRTPASMLIIAPGQFPSTPTGVIYQPSAVYDRVRSHHTHNFIHLLKKQHNYTQKHESENVTNQQHKTLKRYLAQSAQWRHYYVLRSRKFLQKFTFSSVNRNRRQWTVEHLHATAGDLLWLSFENFHKCVRYPKPPNSINFTISFTYFYRYTS